MRILIHAITVLMILASCSDSDEITPIPDPVAPVNLKLFDIDNANDASDLRVFFTVPNSENIEEYRIIVVKSLSSANFSIDEAEILGTGSYQSVPVALGEIKLNLNASLLDSDSEPVVNNETYVVYVLGITSQAVAENVLSNKSGEVTLEDKALHDLYTSSRDGNSVELFDGVTGEYIKSFVPSRTAGLSRTQEVLFGLDGNMYVSGRDNIHILKFDRKTGQFLGNFTNGYDLDEPTKMKYGPDGHLYVSQWGQTKNAVARFDTTTGAFIDEVIPSYFQGMDQAWDSDENLYVTSWGLADIRKYDKDGNFLSVLVNTNLSGPVNLWVRGDDLFVVDWTAGSVKIFDKNSGAFKSVFITGFTRVEGFDFDDEGYLYLCDWEDDLINQYDATDGTFIKTIVNSPKLATPNSVKLGPNQRP